MTASVLADPGGQGGQIFPQQVGPPSVLQSTFPAIPENPALKMELPEELEVLPPLHELQDMVIYLFQYPE